MAGPYAVLERRIGLYSRQTEQFIVHALRKAGCMTVSLVAEVDRKVVGDPDYYKRFGFKNFPELIHEGIPRQYFVVLPFGKTVPRGAVTLHEAFHATA